MDDEEIGEDGIGLLDGPEDDAVVDVFDDEDYEWFQR
jgi:hypothetical protein